MAQGRVWWPHHVFFCSSKKSILNLKYIKKKQKAKEYTKDIRHFRLRMQKPISLTVGLILEILRSN